MKPPRLPPPPPDVNRAWLCLLVNQAATPGLGTIWGGRLAVGRGQLALALVGFCLIVFSMWRNIQNSMLEITGEPLLPPVTAAVTWGAVCFGLAWLWAWFSSVSIVREAQRRERDKPPRLPAG